jgi:GTP-binding protein
VSRPTVAIVGRPNVGKSTLLNRFARSRVAIVEPTAGVTRDRVSVPVRLETSLGQRHVNVIDTGGIGIVDRDDLGPHVEEQVRAALTAADLVLFVVDARDGVTPLDREVAARLRSVELPVMLVVNKVEGDQLQWDVGSFHELGVGEDPIPISAQNGEGVSVLVERMAELLPAPEADEAPPRPVLKLAVVGRRNAGKSTLINTLAREERVIVSEVPGTTRDSVDVLIEYEGESYVVIDTAGVRRKRSIADAIEFFSDARSHRAIRRADVVLLLFDATEEISSIEKRLARYVVDHYKPVILVANKWDLAETFEPEELSKYLSDRLPGLSYAPMAAISAKTGFGVTETLDLAKELADEASRRVSTGALNRVIAKATESRTPSSRGQLVRIQYATQAESTPPTFVLFAKNEKMIGREYLRYLENRLREELDFHSVPLRFVIRPHREAPADSLG